MMPEELPLQLDHICSVIAGTVVYPPGGRFGPRMQQDIQLVMLYTGTMEVVVDDRTLHIQPGHVVKLMPGHHETFKFAEEEETWHRWIAVHVHHLSEEALAFVTQLPVILPLSEEMNRLTDLLLSLQHSALPDDPLLRTLGLAALQLYPTERRLLSDREKHASVYRAIAWMKERYADEIALSDLAEQAGVSSEHLVRLFRQYENDTPMRYLWNLRVKRALDLLVHTGLTVTEIAERCGFKTSHHFSRHMKQATGLTATQIRHNSWQGLRTSKLRHPDISMKKEAPRE
ncbi:AraC family transcriptional regulator [Paenibacillus sp. FSL H7-0326]|uniref:AraC family transcriptional regulator n=1 Tax=Paenibacillus sp. FSL H7-0326 TaxID=1921144 RepID=UPI00096E8477|nr:AraC family transcriptional regulator [Paenibacillus sp. FSL H7-0326]OMC67609.1 AraC family transcriptional regulator [Paenibacillus sp. FSL H7-0326]